MPTETQEHQRTVRALTKIWNFVKAGGYEYVNFVMARVTDNAVGTSFLGDCDMMQPTAVGARGILKSFSDPSRNWISKAHIFSGSSVTNVELAVEINLNTGKVTCHWTPLGFPPQNTSFKMEYEGTSETDMGTNTRFHSDGSSDGALYVINVLTN